MKLEPGDKIWLGKADVAGYEDFGWAVYETNYLSGDRPMKHFHPEGFRSPCGVLYDAYDLYLETVEASDILETIDEDLATPNWVYMAEQLIADGTIK